MNTSNNNNNLIESKLSRRNEANLILRAVQTKRSHTVTGPAARDTPSLIIMSETILRQDRCILYIHLYTPSRRKRR